MLHTIILKKFAKIMHKITFFFVKLLFFLIFYCMIKKKVIEYFIINLNILFIQAKIKGGYQLCLMHKTYWQN